MTGSVSLAVVVPCYRSGLSLWRGVAELLAWRHPAVHRLRLVLVDDASPAGAWRAAEVVGDGVEVVALVNPARLGKAASCRRGLERSDAEWTLFLEDDLLGWAAIADLVADHLGDDVDLVSVARVGRVDRRAVEPLIRWLFRRASDHALRDPTSPLKAVRTASVSAAVLDRWPGLLDEALLLSSRRVVEVVPPALAWDGRPSRYRPVDRVGLALRLAPRLVAGAVRGPRR
jgi:glycosyltransferase involved in cell wall biosynthesis